MLTAFRMLPWRIQSLCVIINCICGGGCGMGQVLLQESGSEVELTRNLVSEKQDCILSLEQALTKCRSDLAELEKKLHDALQAGVSTLLIFLDCTKFNLFLLLSIIKPLTITI